MEHPMRRRSRFSATASALAACALLAACGGDDGGGGGGGGGAASGGGESILSEPARNAKAIDPNAAQNAQGEVTFCIGGSLEGHRQVVRQFNQQGGDRARILALPASADEQRQQRIQRLEALSGGSDVLAMASWWTAEYVHQGWPVK